MPIQCSIIPYTEDITYTREYGSELRYTDDGRGSMRGGEIIFRVTPEPEGGDGWLFVCDSSFSCFYTRVPRERRVLFLTEPREITVYPAGYLRQFGVVVSPYELPDFGGRVITANPCLGWFAGSRAFASVREALAWTPPPKTREISMVTSLKGRLRDRKSRVALLNALRDALGPRLGCYGREFAPLDDKLDGIAEYKYHVAVENSRTPLYWTEKLADAWMGWALPLYSGAPGIKDQLPDPRGVELIDIDDISGTVARISEILREDPYESRLEAIRKCREWVIAEANPCERVCRIIESNPEAAAAPPLAEPEMVRVLIRGIKARALAATERLFGKRAADAAVLAYCRSKGRTREAR